MSDDAQQPTSSFLNSAHQTFGSLTHFIDENIRIIQYGVYGVGVVGAAVVLHSARAFSSFIHPRDIPKEFIANHVRLHGLVKSVSKVPPLRPTEPTLRKALLPSSANAHSHQEKQASKDKSEEIPKNLANPASQPPILSPVINTANTSELVFKDGRVPASEADRDIIRLEYDEELHPVYLQVEHSPIFRFPWRSRESALSLQLAAIEVNSDGLNQSKAELIGQRIWFTLISYNSEKETLISFIRPAKLWQRKHYNEKLVLKGQAIVGDFDLDLFEDKKYVKVYERLIKAQEYAEKKKAGMWQASLTQEHGIITRFWLWAKKTLKRERD